MLDHYALHARDLPWRHTHDAYAILVSEIMLQQTQVVRVVPKYQSFLAAFPTLSALAGAPTTEVLSAWQGLGYNRRALALQRSSAIIETDFGGVIPCSVAELRKLPGIGDATAAAVCVYAYDQPLPFIETNIRSAFIHFFFQECTSVSDAELLPLVELALDTQNPRDWYYALMDYGAWIKSAGPNPGRRSRHHARQSRFAGSRREARGAILRTLLEAGPQGITLDMLTDGPPSRNREESELKSILDELAEEGFLRHEGSNYRVA